MQEIDISDNRNTPQFRNESKFQVLIPTKLKYRNVNRLTFIIISLCFSSFYFGFSLTYLSSVSTTTLQNFFKINPQKVNVTLGNLIGCLPVGAILGALITPIAMKFLSRKTFLLFFNAVAIFIAGIIQINNLALLYVCRIFTGILAGCFMAITPIYINQLVPVDIQGSFGAFTQLHVIIGIVLCYLLGVIFTLTDVQPEITWRVLFSFTGVTATIQSCLLLFNFIPQSPVSLIEQGKTQEAIKVLLMFNVPEMLQKVYAQTEAKTQMKIAPKNIKNEQFAQLQQQKTPKEQEKLEQQKSVSGRTEKTFKTVKTFKSSNTGKHIKSVKVIKQGNKQIDIVEVENEKQRFQIPIIAKAMFLGFQLPFMQQLSGTNMIVTQIGSIVGQYDQSLALYAPLIANVVQVIATGFSVLALSVYGRRTLILAGNYGLAFVDIVIAVMFLLLDLIQWKPAVYIALIFIMIFMIIYGVTIGPTVWLYVPEIIPARFVPTATCMNWIGCSFSILVTPQILDSTNSSYPVFFMFGGITLVFAIINSFLVIETKGLSLVQISKKMMNS